MASIHLNVDGGPYVFNGMKSPGLFVAQNQTVRNLIQEAWGRPSGQSTWLPVFVAAGAGVPITGGPEWLGTDRYNIQAKWNMAPLDAGSARAQNEMNRMLRTLLQQRFQIQLHQETRQLPVYELTVSSATQLRHGSCRNFDPSDVSPPGVSSDYCGGSSYARKGRDWILDGSGMTMSELADTLSLLIGTRTVLDRTGYSGTFDVHMRWTAGPGELGAAWGEPSPDDVGESVFTVVRRQLGLKLTAATGPVDVIVVDNAQRPSPN